MQLSPIPPRSTAAPLVIPEDVPVYRLRTDCYLDDTFYPENSVIALEDKPSQHMQPLNKIAYDKMVEYLTKLDDLGLQVEARTGKRYVPVLPPFLAAYDSLHVRKKVARLDEVEQVPLMGAKKQSYKARKIEADGESNQLSVLGNGRQNLNLSVGNKGIG